ncbi:ArnT family glycosyltransferase [Halosimplex aquaticum]|uniref:ArnT family glycosyltransferase n=1 Tax=Halosimplex aquaticum TaxID=3026162 RepID=A0ABD5XV73_9EURY|nr:glycosyltransferase family 39 protein [Halosimplex aquaticum]
MSGVVTSRPLLALVIAGVCLRLLLLDFVAVSSDAGLFVYDARMILLGNTPIVDYPTRSPLFHYLLAGALALVGGGSRILGARLFMIAVSALLGVAVFALARRLHSRRAGLAAAAIFLGTPVAYVYGIPVKTELVAQLLGVTALLLAVRAFDGERISHGEAALAGAFVGAGFLVRRVVLVHLVAVAVVASYYRLTRYDRQLPDLFVSGVALFGGALLTVVFGYVAIALPDVGQVRPVAVQHALSSFIGTGAGNVAWVEQSLTTGAETAEESTGGLLAAVCQGCDAGTLRIVMWSVVVSLPAVLPFLVYLRSAIDRYADERVRRLTPVVLVVGLLGGTAAGGLLFARHAEASPLLVVLPASVVLAAVAVVWRGPAPAREWPFDSRLALPALVVAFIVGGYLYRDSPVSVWYMLDLIPYVAVLAGVAVAVSLETGEWGDRRLAFAGVVLAVAVVVATVASVPFLPARAALGEGTSGLETVSDVQAAGADLDERTEPGDRVLTADALYVTDADRRLAGDLSRGFWLLKHTTRTPAADRIEAQMLSEMEDGRVPYVVVGPRTRTLLDRSPELARAVDAHYCPTDEEFYRKHDAELYVESAEAPACGS